MTIEEAILEIDNITDIDGSVYPQRVIDLIVLLYDDIKSMTCDNCKHSQQVNETGTLECYNDVSSWHIDHDYRETELYVDRDFGCNKFETKQA